MIYHKIADRSPVKTYRATVDIKRSELEHINKLLSISNLEEMSENEKKLGAKQDEIINMFSANFEDGSILTWDLCSGRNNYFDDVVFTRPNGNWDALDCSYELDDIVVETDNKIYRVELNIIE